LSLQPTETSSCYIASASVS